MIFSKGTEHRDIPDLTVCFLYVDEGEIKCVQSVLELCICGSPCNRTRHQWADQSQNHVEISLNICSTGSVVERLLSGDIDRTRLHLEAPHRQKFVTETNSTLTYIDRLKRRLFSTTDSKNRKRSERGRV